MTLLDSEFQMKQKLITDEYAHFYYHYGTKPDTSPGTCFGNMDSEKVARQRSYEKLWMTAEPLATKGCLADQVLPTGLRRERENGGPSQRIRDRPPAQDATVPSVEHSAAITGH
jgi:hypothetical protein